jgi:hypothetical protein
MVGVHVPDEYNEATVELQEKCKSMQGLAGLSKGELKCKEKDHHLQGQQEASLSPLVVTKAIMQYSLGNYLEVAVILCFSIPAV